MLRSTLCCELWARFPQFWRTRTTVKDKDKDKDNGEGPKAGPKGLQLKVEAQRAPRLLSKYIC